MTKKTLKSPAEKMNDPQYAKEFNKALANLVEKLSQQENKSKNQKKEKEK